MIKDEKLDIYTNIKNEVRKNILDNKLIQNNTLSYISHQNYILIFLVLK